MILLCTASLSIGQTAWCGTPQDDAFMQDLIDNKANWDRTIRRGAAPRYVPITFHLVADSEGKGRMGLPALYQGLCRLNERYEDIGVDLYFYIDRINEIDRSSLFSDPRQNGEALYMRGVKDANSMNIFVVGNIPGNTLGYYTPGFSNDYIVIRKQNIGDSGLTIEHEIGHFFTLAHPHRGWEDRAHTLNGSGYDDDGEPLGACPVSWEEKVMTRTLTSSQVSGSVNVELVDGSNCGISGDNICDTPADYGQGFCCGCCRSAWTVLDRNCDTLAPMFNNIMGYAAGCSDWTFTPDQILAMQTSFDANNREYLRTNEVNEYEPVDSEMVVYTYPEDKGFQDEYDLVTLKWEAVPNAEFYIVNVNDDEYVTSTNSQAITNLAPDQSFIFWGVKAYNKFGGGCADFAQQYFSVGDQETSAVTDLGFVDNLNVFPNPATTRSELTVSFETSKSFKGDIQIFDITGKTLFTSSVTFNQGSNGYQIPLQGLSEGIHILEIRTDEGSITEKLVIK